MRISDWSSDVCSSDLHFREDGRKAPGQGDLEVPRPGRGRWTLSVNSSMDPALDAIRQEAAAWFARRRDGALAPDEEETFEHWRRRDEAHARVYAERSEEHTSELQSLMRISYAVFCLQKKNNATK